MPILLFSFFQRHFPRSTSAQVFVSKEVMPAFFFSILVIADVVQIRKSLGKKNRKD